MSSQRAILEKSQKAAITSLSLPASTSKKENFKLPPNDHGKGPKLTCPNQSTVIKIHAGISHEHYRHGTKPSFGLILYVGDGVAQIGRQLCGKCCKDSQTPLFQTLRAYEAALRFTHSLSIPESKSLLPTESMLFTNVEVRKNNFDIEGRGKLKPIILCFYSNSNYIKYMGELTEHEKYGLFIKKINKLISCLVLNGNGVVVTTPQSFNPKLRRKSASFKEAQVFNFHYEKWAHAKSLAKNVSFGTFDEDEVSVTSCITCNSDFVSINELAIHFRNEHVRTKQCSQHDDCFDLSERLRAKCFESSAWTTHRRRNKSL